jgi:hypothetical protein
MKTLNTIIISILLALSVNATVSAADLHEQTAEMNIDQRVLFLYFKKLKGKLARASYKKDPVATTL